MSSANPWIDAKGVRSSCVMKPSDSARARSRSTLVRKFVSVMIVPPLGERLVGGSGDVRTE